MEATITYAWSYVNKIAPRPGETGDHGIHLLYWIVPKKDGQTFGPFVGGFGKQPNEDEEIYIDCTTGKKIECLCWDEHVTTEKAEQMIKNSIYLSSSFSHIMIA